MGTTFFSKDLYKDEVSTHNRISQTLKGSTMYTINILSLLLSLIILSSSLIICRASLSTNDLSFVEGSGKGPNDWGRINPEWRICAIGKMQSPIDIHAVEVVFNFGNLTTDYKPAPAKLKNREHDVAVEWTGNAGKININGTDYKLLQCHWHSPSEHTLNGRRFDMELHLVHQSSNGKKAVIGVPYIYGPPDPFLAKLIQHIGTLGKEKEINVGNVNPLDINFGTDEYYRYIGSLTVPPCTENIIWNVVKKVKTVSAEQVSALKNVVPTGFKDNARPIQKLEGRTVWLQTSI